METPLIQTMKKFTSADLTDLLAKKYVYEYGEKKAKEILNKVSNSKKIEELLTSAYNVGRFPTAKEILATLHVVPFFIIAKPETMCLAALCTVIIFENEISNLSDDIKYKQENISLCIDIIKDCYRFKITKSKGIFDSFFNEITVMEKNESLSNSFWDNPEKNGDIVWD